MRGKALAGLGIAGLGSQPIGRPGGAEWLGGKTLVFSLPSSPARTVNTSWYYS